MEKSDSEITKSWRRGALVADFRPHVQHLPFRLIRGYSVRVEHHFEVGAIDDWAGKVVEELSPSSTSDPRTLTSLLLSLLSSHVDHSFYVVTAEMSLIH